MKHFIVYTIFAFCLSVTCVSAQISNEIQASEAGTELSEISAEPAVATDSNKALWDKANTAYYNNDFSGAIAAYDSIEQSGLESATLYYNMGNAWFKAGRIGKSILYFNKAQRLAPGNRDIEHNLEIANTYTRNRIESLPEFFLRRWMRGLSSVMSGNAWAWCSVGLFAFLLAGVLVYLLPLQIKIRKLGFWSAVGGSALFILAFSFASHYYRETTKPTGGIVTSTSASVKSSPDNAGKDLFLLYEGAKVEVLDELNGWSEIMLADGNQGWIKSGTIEIID